MNIVFHITWGIGDFKAFILFPAMSKSAIMQDLLNTCLLRHCQEKIADRLASVKILKRFVLCNVLRKGRFGKFEKGYAPGFLCEETFHVMPCFETLHRVCWMFLPRYLCNQQPIWKRFLGSVNSTSYSLCLCTGTAHRMGTRKFHSPNGTVHFICTDPKKASASLIVVLVSGI